MKEENGAYVHVYDWRRKTIHSHCYKHMFAHGLAVASDHSSAQDLATTARLHLHLHKQLTLPLGEHTPCN